MAPYAPAPVTPKTATATQATHIRPSGAVNPTTSAHKATRSLHQADSNPRLHSQHVSQPASQESFVSVQSQGSSVAAPFHSSSSNLSQLTNYTDPTSPPSSARLKHTEQLSHVQQRARTPEHTRYDVQAGGDYPSKSPTGLTSPLSVNGAKRTASGHVKNAPSLESMPSTPTAATHGRRRSRAESTSSTNSRAGEMAQTLKARLGYAMAKVQHGWEHKNLAEVEQLAAHKAFQNQHTAVYGDYSQRPVSAGLSNGAARLSMYDSYKRDMLDGPTSPPFKRRSGNFAGSMTSPPQYQRTNAGGLQPPADIRPTTSRHQYQQYSTSSIEQANQTHSTAMSPPRTPVNGQQQARRPLNVRTDTQTAQAERDALDALFQLGSPHGAQSQSHFSRHVNNLSQNSSQQGSPLRGEYQATPRRVTFARSESDRSSARSDSIEEEGSTDA
ncbi:hypothetical protein B0A50_02794 [Salinomyces thailandicus]|uniref:Uncharacterized protein n=1 Tax=Salinomyces thailandicus TaxID=706561 RepID=A0A4U0U785_9PEZI|nr:hypothetical protein B0A50_02794 [Salinomyces thailandica]